MAEYIVPTKQGDFSVSSRDELTPEQQKDYVWQYTQDQKPLVVSDNGPVFIRSPGQQQASRVFSSVPDPMAMREAYERNVAAPIAGAIQSFTRNPTVQQGVGTGLSSFNPGDMLPGGVDVQGLETPQAQQSAGQGFLVPAEKSVTGITDDPAMLGLTVASAALPLAGVSLINPMQKVLPTLMQRAAQMIVPGVAQGLTYGGLDALTNPNTTGASSFNKGAGLALIATGMNLVSRIFGRLLGGSLDAQLADKITSNLEATLPSDGASLSANPQQWLRDIAKVAEKGAQEKLASTSARLTEYVKVRTGNDPQTTQVFSNAMAGLSQAVDDLAKGDTNALTRINASLDRTIQVVQGTAGTGSPLTQPSDQVLAYLFSKDPQFIQTLVRSNALTPTQAASILGSSYRRAVGKTEEEATNILLRPDKDGVPLFKQYASAADIQRVTSQYGANQQGLTSQRDYLAQQQLGLDLWKRTVAQQAIDMVELNKARDIASAALRPGITSGVEMQRAALAKAQEYASTEAHVRSAIEAVYGNAVNNIQRLQYVNPADLRYGWMSKQFPALHSLAESRARGSIQPTGLTRFLPGSSAAINVGVAKELQELNK